MKLIVIKADKYIAMDSQGYTNTAMDKMPELVNVVEYDSEVGGHYEMADGSNVLIAPGDEAQLAVYVSMFEKRRVEETARLNDPLYRLGTQAGRDKALIMKKAELEAKAMLLQSENYEFDGHNYFAAADDLTTMQSVFLMCLALADVESIPTPPPYVGYWLSADLDGEGNRVPVPFVVGTFKQMINSLYERNASIWGKKQLHIAAIDALYAAGVSGYKILEYDVNVNW